MRDISCRRFVKGQENSTILSEEVNEISQGRSQQMLPYINQDCYTEANILFVRSHGVAENEHGHISLIL